MPLLKGHFWLLSSGSSGNQRAIALSKEALLTSAEAVNTHLGSSSCDVWINPLPTFHVGGLGIEMRAKLSGAKVMPLKKWSARAFISLCREATLSSLVPTQVYDLVTLGLRAPENMRAIVVGGGALSDLLYKKGKALGWPLIPSYGLTECASQVATGGKLLGHIEAKITSQGKIALKSPSLLTAYALLEEDKVWDPKVNGWFETEDYGELQENALIVKGRESDFVKISGESVHIGALEHLFGEQGCCFVAIADARLGHAIHLVIEGEVTEKVNQAIERYHKKVMPFEKIHKVHTVKELPRSSLGKILKTEVISLLGE